MLETWKHVLTGICIDTVITFSPSLLGLSITHCESVTLVPPLPTGHKGQAETGGVVRGQEILKTPYRLFGF